MDTTEIIEYFAMTFFLLVVSRKVCNFYLSLLQIYS